MLFNSQSWCGWYSQTISVFVSLTSCLSLQTHCHSRKSWCWCLDLIWCLDVYWCVGILMCLALTNSQSPGNALTISTCFCPLALFILFYSYFLFSFRNHKAWYILLHKPIRLILCFFPFLFFILFYHCQSPHSASEVEHTRGRKSNKWNEWTCKSISVYTIDTSV